MRDLPSGQPESVNVGQVLYDPSGRAHAEIQHWRARQEQLLHIQHFVGEHQRLEQLGSEKGGAVDVQFYVHNLNIT